MADVKTVAIRLKAYNDQFKKSMHESGDSVSSFGKISTVALLAAGTAAVAFAKKSADAYIAYGKSIMKLSRISGENVEASSKMAFAAQQSGLSVDTLANGIKFLQKNMAAGNPEFAKLGVNVKDAGGNLRDTHSVLLDTADALSKMDNVAEKNAATLKIFGRAGLDLGPLLNKGREGILALENQAREYGVVLSKDNVAAIQANVKAHRQMDAAMLGLQVQIGQYVVPALTTLEQGLAGATHALNGVPAPIFAVGAALGAVVVLGPKVVAGFTAMKAAGGAMGVGIAAGAAVAIAGVIELSRRSQQAALEAQKAAQGKFDFTNYSAAARAYNEQAAALEAMAKKWNGYSYAEKLAHAQEDKDRREMAAQHEENGKHIDELRNRIQHLATDLGISTAEAQALQESLGIDLTQVDPGRYTEIIRAMTAGDIDAAEAKRRLQKAQQDATMATEDQTAAMEELRIQSKAANDAQRASLEPQFAMIDAQRKAWDAQKAVADANRTLQDSYRGVEAAQYGLETSHRAVAAAQRGVTEADEARVEAARNVEDAIRAQGDAQRALDELLQGPTEDESLGIESAAIALEEARRRAAGLEGDDPELKRRRDALDLRRAEIALEQAQGAHDVAVEEAQKRLADATTAVAEARDAEVEAARAAVEAGYSLRDAQRAEMDAGYALRDARRAVEDAELAVVDAQLNAARTAIDLDTATRDLMTAYATGDVSVDKNLAALQRWVDQGKITADQAWLLAQAMVAAHAAIEGGDPDAAAAAVSGGAAGRGSGRQTTAPTREIDGAPSGGGGENGYYRPPGVYDGTYWPGGIVYPGMSGLAPASSFTPHGAGGAGAPAPAGRSVSLTTNNDFTGLPKDEAFEMARRADEMQLSLLAG